MHQNTNRKIYGQIEVQTLSTTFLKSSAMYFCTSCETEKPHGLPIPDRGGVATCDDCGTENKIPWLPLFVVTGGGGCGKTTVGKGLLRKPNPFFVLEADYLLRARESFDSYDEYWDYVTFVSRQLTMNLRPVVLCGWVNPSQIEQSRSSIYFSAIHYLVVACDAATQATRLNGRYPRERQSPPTPQDVDKCVSATRYISEEASSRSNATVLDTTHQTRDQTISAAESWILDRL